MQCSSRHSTRVLFYFVVRVLCWIITSLEQLINEVILQQKTRTTKQNSGQMAAKITRDIRYPEKKVITVAKAL